MPLIRENGVAADPWVFVADGEAVPTDRPAIVTLARWQAERNALRLRNLPIGLQLRSDQSPSQVAGDIDRFDVIALEFPKFTDGRAYSAARLLRERYGYTGELRAVGNVLRDQLQFMHRCGFDAFEIVAEDGLEQWHKALAEIAVWYQPAADLRAPVRVLRRRERQQPQDADEEPAPGIQASASLLGASEYERSAICAGYWAY